jgi:hypothetical protein
MLGAKLVLKPDRTSSQCGNAHRRGTASGAGKEQIDSKAHGDMLDLSPAIRCARRSR